MSYIFALSSSLEDISPTSVEFLIARTSFVTEKGWYHSGDTEAIIKFFLDLSLLYRHQPYKKLGSKIKVKTLKA